MRFVAILFAVCMISFSAPEEAQACSQLNKADQKKTEAKFARALSKAKKVKGTYKIDGIAVEIPSDFDGMERGGIYARSGKKKYATVSTGPLFYCTLYSRPFDGSKGTFYIRKAGKKTYEIIHFE